MSSEADYSPDEWKKIADLPFKVIFAAVVADVRGPRGAAAMETAVGARHLVSEAVSSYADVGLIVGVLQTAANDEVQDDDISLDDEAARVAATSIAVSLAEEVNALLQTRSDDDASSYLQWIYDSAEAVCNAAESGGILTIGAKRVSDKEAELLAQLRAAFNLPEREE